MGSLQKCDTSGVLRSVLHLSSPTAGVGARDLLFDTAIMALPVELRTVMYGNGVADAGFVRWNPRMERLCFSSYVPSRHFFFIGSPVFCISRSFSDVLPAVSVAKGKRQAQGTNTKVNGAGLRSREVNAHLHHRTVVSSEPAKSVFERTRNTSY